MNKTASDHHLAVIEDAAQSFGVEYKGRMAGSLAHAGCTSFFPAKPLGCYGDGGAVLTDSDDLAEILKSIRIHGKGKDKYDNVRPGINGRLDTLQAAILLPKLDIFPHELVSRRRIARNYTDLLTAQNTSLILPGVFSGMKSAWAQYSILAQDARARQAIQDRLQENSIPTAVYYPTPLHLQTAFAHLGNKKGDFPVSEDCAERIFSIPMHPYLTVADLKKICSILHVDNHAA
ncbi:MAG: DegT/DnrJ/EryC1/StrS family aminotransferase [Desulfobacteraceae bacterium]|nr:DegT/DnrJ/EryC1/StrS family aminotransferase [Desulfobacteraceae bacterium]